MNTYLSRARAICAVALLLSGLSRIRACGRADGARHRAGQEPADADKSNAPQRDPRALALLDAAKAKLRGLQSLVADAEVLGPPPSGTCIRPKASIAIA